MDQPKDWLIMIAPPGTMWSCLFLPLHATPGLVLGALIAFSKHADDPFLLWFGATFAWCYFPLFIGLLSHWWLYKPASTSPGARAEVPLEDVKKTKIVPLEGAEKKNITLKDIAIVLSTVSAIKGNEDLEESLTTCFLNRPNKIVVVTDTDTRAKEAKNLLDSIRTKIQDGSSKFLKTYDPTGTYRAQVKVDKIEAEAHPAGEANKRLQMLKGADKVRTDIIMYLDDHVFLKPGALDKVAPIFNGYKKTKIGMCGLTKTVRRKKPQAGSILGRYFESFWNVMGALYLERHNFEILATNAVDGGVFVVSGRAFLILTEIMNNDSFNYDFRNEYFFFGKYGPLKPDDDNFITRWAREHGYKIKTTDATTVETTLGVYPKYISQCLRWGRTRIRQNPRALWNPTLWVEWPWTVWTTYIWGLLNLSLLWDPAMVILFMCSKFYREVGHPQTLLICLVAWIYFSKLVKVIPYFRRHPLDFFLFFFPIPASPLFGYFHSILMIYAYLTFKNCDWSGRNLENSQKSSPDPSKSKKQE